LSVVIPARNAAAHVDGLLAALLPQLLPGDECFLVDDCSPDGAAQIAKEHGVTVVSSGKRAGPAAARNLGARQSTRDVLVFLDSDVAPHPGLLSRMREQLRRSPDLDALFGSYDANPPAPSTVSRFRNLLHCYTHRQGDPDASTFWAGCGAIRRAAFDRIGGFDAARFPEPSIEDIELGVRLKRSGGRIRLDPSLQVTHRKVWSLRSMLRADLLHRAIPWSLLILETGKAPLDLNLKASQRVSGLAVAGIVAAGLFAPWEPRAAAAGVMALLAILGLLNAPFYRFLAACGGWPFALRSAPLHWLYFLCAGAGFVIACGQFLVRRLYPRIANRRVDPRIR
jgi:glycosyltransferase involved in cell wall biosynthesis